MKTPAARHDWDDDGPGRPAVGGGPGTASITLLALGLGVLLGVPDGVFGTTIQYTLLASIAVVGACTIAGAAVLERRGASPLSRS